jgi:acyl-CoA thioesterase-2
MAMPHAAADLRALLSLERIDLDLFRASHLAREERPLYGGQVAAQALAAAGATLQDGRLPHSLHGYFLRPGDSHRPTLFRVDRDRDGRSFSSRRVVAIQGGEVIFNMAASFQEPRVGTEVQVTAMPDVPGPDDLPPYVFARQPALDVRVVLSGPEPASYPLRFWARYRHALPSEGLLHACVLTYLSDVSTGLASDPDGRWVASASVDHALWLHRPVALDSWVLVDLVGRVIAGDRGLYTGSVFSSNGTLVATISQEMLYRRVSRPGLVRI